MYKIQILTMLLRAFLVFQYAEKIHHQKVVFIYGYNAFWVQKTNCGNINCYCFSDEIIYEGTSIYEIYIDLFSSYA